MTDPYKWSLDATYDLEDEIGTSNEKEGARTENGVGTAHAGSGRRRELDIVHWALLFPWFAPSIGNCF